MARILCVDDEHVEVKCEVLASAGHTVTPAASAREAIEKLRDNDYDAVVTDWLLGDAEGRVVVEAARSKSNGDMPIIVVTAFPDIAFQSPEPLADLYLPKPVDPEELITIVNEFLKKRGK
jgi:CheY-like chemotaxis protein